MEESLIPRQVSLASQPTTISVLVLDSSSSMEGLTETAKSAVEGHMQHLKEDEGHAHICGVIGFADSPYVVIPLSPVEKIPGTAGYEPNGNTLLWKTVVMVLRQLKQLAEGLQASGRTGFKIVVGVFSDGADNLSGEECLPALRELSMWAGQQGWELMTFGIGIDGPVLAQVMGFPTDPGHAVTVAATPEGVRHATITMTMTTRGGRWRPKSWSV